MHLPIDLNCPILPFGVVLVRWLAPKAEKTCAGWPSLHPPAVITIAHNRARARSLTRPPAHQVPQIFLSPPSSTIRLRLRSHLTIIIPRDLPPKVDCLRSVVQFDRLTISRIGSEVTKPHPRLPPHHPQCTPLMVIRLFPQPGVTTHINHLYPALPGLNLPTKPKPHPWKP